MMQARRIWVQVHLWLGLTLGIVGALVGLSGCILVYEHAIDSWMHPVRYAIAGTDAARPIADYVQQAESAFPPGTRVVAMRFPDGEASPVTAIVRGERGMQRVYLDPASGEVLDIGSSDELIAWLHQFHESLNLREYGGRSIVGVVGIAMLVSSLTGLYLWWPAAGLRRTGIGFRRGLALHRNLHYTLGFFGFVVLTIVSFTGIVLGFPDASRSVVGSVTTVSPRIVQGAERQGRGIGPDEAVTIAIADYAGATVAGVGFPQGPRGAYRISLRERNDASARPSTVVFVDPGTRSVIARNGRARGDTFLVWQRMLHEGSAFGGIYKFLVFLCGLLPAIFVVTGLLMWLRARRRRAQPRASLHVPAVARDDGLTR